MFSLPMNSDFPRVKIQGSVAKTASCSDDWLMVAAMAVNIEWFYNLDHV